MYLYVRYVTPQYNLYECIRNMLDVGVAEVAEVAEGQVKNLNGGEGDNERKKGGNQLNYGQRVHLQKIQRMELT